VSAREPSLGAGRSTSAVSVVSVAHTAAVVARMAAAVARTAAAVESCCPRMLPLVPELNM